MSSFHLATPRLALRPMRLEDAADLAERRSDPETAAFQAWTPPYPLERAMALIEGLVALGEPTTGEWFQFAVERRADGVVVGDVALRLDGDGHNGEIGFTLNPWARGNGYATEAAQAVLQYGFVERRLHRFEASLDPRNVASAKVLERLGFRLEGTLIESYWLGDVVTDDARYGLLRSEWLTARP